MSETLGRLFYQERVDRMGQPIRRRFFWGGLNQYLVENGFSPPWIMNLEECHDHWNIVSNESTHTPPPVEYARKTMDIVELMHRFWRPEVSPEMKILELGCNCGANLNGLLQKGYSRLSGIEINRDAVKEMERWFPELARQAAVSPGSLEEILPKMASRSVDVVFSMATLFHIHPRSRFVFPEIVRVAARYILVVEAETANCGYIFSRNYRRVFERLGCHQLKSALITPGAFPELSVRGYDGYVIRLMGVRPE